jgi:hypothetical protein
MPGLCWLPHWHAGAAGLWAQSNNCFQIIAVLSGVTCTVKLDQRIYLFDVCCPYRCGVLFGVRHGVARQLAVMCINDEQDETS